MSWQDFWNGTTTIYANDRHRDVHYRKIADDIIALIPTPSARVLDFGCGEALSADLIARSCSTLFLCDAAENVRERIKSRTDHLANTRTVSPEAVEAMPDGSFDVIVANSVIQYLSSADLDRWLATWRRVLAADGKLIVGDIVPRSVGPLVDAAALLRFARQHGFLIAATGGLVRTALSDYRRKRAELGLLQLEEREIIELAGRAGFDAKRSDRNIGHNPARLTVVATPIPQFRPAEARAGEATAQRLEATQPAAL